VSNSLEVGVVYLARQADGLDAFRRFSSSYKLRSAGTEHDLIVIYKGFEQRTQLTEAQRIFDGVPHVGVELSDTGFDIGSYLEISKRVSNKYLCFLNTHTEIRTDGWLAALVKHVVHDNVGVVGAMGSYESIRDSVSMIREIIWRAAGADGCDDERCAFYFDFVLKRFHPKWYSEDGGVLVSTEDAAPFSTLAKKAARAIRRAVWYPKFAIKGTALIWPGSPSFNYRAFPSFPNPHIRSNGFIIEKDKLLEFRGALVTNKIDANLFESGPEGLTAAIRRKGLAALVVGADGDAYATQDWWRSNTFRLGSQSNLLVSDNHTRAFDAMSNGARLTHERMTWGDYARTRPSDYPDLDYFKVVGKL
jgi:hypothetical protein